MAIVPLEKQKKVSEDPVGFREQIGAASAEQGALAETALQPDYLGAALDRVSVAQAAVSTMDVSTKRVRTQFFAPNFADSTTLVGGGDYVRTNSEPSHGGKFRSVDRWTAGGVNSPADGGWWELSTVRPAPEQFGIIGGGIASDTAAVMAADSYAYAKGVPLSLDRNYEISVPLSSLMARRVGSGNFIVSGRSGPAAPREEVKNRIWGGHFAIAQATAAIGTTTFRRTMLDGMTGARLDFSTGVSVIQDDGLYHPFSALIQRSAANANTSSFVACWPLSVTESKPFQGRRAFVSFYSRRGADFSAPDGEATIKVIAHRSSLQAIKRADGLYDLGTLELASYTWTPGLDMEPWLAPQWFTFDAPGDVGQIAVVLTVPYSGTAGDNDWLRIEGLHSDVGAVPTVMPDASREELIVQAKTRFRSSYAYGVNPGTPTLEGSLAANATATTANGVIFNVNWDEPMVTRPTVIPHSPIIGGNPRIGNETAGTRIFAQLYDVSPTGFWIGNADAAVVGNRYRAHWSATATI